MNLHASITSRSQRLIRRIGQLLARPVLDEVSILATLRSMPDNRRPVIMVHSSLSACGKVRGGVAAVLGAMCDWTEGGTLAMPTHTYCYPNERGQIPVFDPARTPSLVGTVSDVFWRKSGVVRSLHPTHSIAASGPLAHELVAGHELTDTPCGTGTPYEKLLREDVGVLMYGVTLNAHTLFHIAEAMAAVPYLYFPQQVNLRFRSQEGVTRDMRMWRQNMTVPRRFAEMDSWLEERGLLHRKPCGNGELLWLPHAQAVHQALIAEMSVDPWLLVPKEARPAASAS